MEKEVESCKHFSWERARKNGKACEICGRCKPFFYECECEYYEKNSNKLTED